MWSDECKVGVQFLEVVIVLGLDNFGGWSWWASDWGMKTRSSKKRRFEFAIVATIQGSGERIKVDF